MGDRVIAEKPVGKHTIYGIDVQVVELTWRDGSGPSYDVTAATAGGDVCLTEDGSYGEYPTDTWLHDLVAEWLGKQHPFIDAIVQGALLRTQHLKEGWDKAVRIATAQGKHPERSKRVHVAEAQYEGALLLLAHVLGTVGIGDVMVADVPSCEFAARYLEKWDAERTRRALQRAVTG
jgi:hypothetical protein